MESQPRLGHRHRIRQDWTRSNESFVHQGAAGVRSSLTRPESVVISGIIGPRGDGYVAGDVPDLQEAEAYHRPQIESFAAAGADLTEALTMTSANEAGGIVLAANSVGLPVAILFTVRPTDAFQMELLCGTRSNELMHLATLPISASTVLS